MTSEGVYCPSDDIVLFRPAFICTGSVIMIVTSHEAERYVGSSQTRATGLLGGTSVAAFVLRA
jgi:hypothetical protein